jgi:hypothetical protein
MKIILVLSHFYAIDSEQWSFRVFYLSARWDWLRSSIKFRFYHLTCLKINVKLFLFVIFSTFSFVFVQLFFIYRLSLRLLRNHNLTLSFFLDDSKYSNIFLRRTSFYSSDISTKLKHATTTSTLRKRHWWRTIDNKKQCIHKNTWILTAATLTDRSHSNFSETSKKWWSQ